MATTTEMHLPSSNAEERSGANRFNYRGMHRYLITLPAFKAASFVADRETILGVLEALREASTNHHFDVYAYSFLPDALTLIVRGKAETSDMKQFLALFRQTSSGRLEARLGHPLWKKKYTERVLRRKEDTRTVARDILQIPVRAGLAPSAAEYEFQGSFVTNLTRPTPAEPTGGNWKERKPRLSSPPGKEWRGGKTDGRRSEFPRGRRDGGKNRGR